MFILIAGDIDFPTDKKAQVNSIELIGEFAEAEKANAVGETLLEHGMLSYLVLNDYTGVVSVVRGEDSRLIEQFRGKEKVTVDKQV